MCGIIGAWGKPASDRVLEANNLQAHRGPDDQGYYVDNDAQVALAHVRLSILDPSPLGHQPMVNDSEGVVLVFNGEIYNFRELRSQLEAEGVSFRGHSDTEVLLALYLRFGEKMLSKINGIFAIAVWDKRSQELLVARDALGVKPFYFSELDDGFAFASELKALMPLLGDRRELDPVSIHRYLSFLWCPGEGTPLKGVRKLLPGEAMVIRRGSINRRWQWYQLPVFRTRSVDMSEESAVLETEAALRTAVHRQMVADVPVGAFLSGGLDSSAVVAMAREKAPDIRCFTIESTGGVEDGYTDDLTYAHTVASHLHVPLDVVSIDSAKMASDLENMVYQLDEPLADPAPLNVLYISRLARENGIKVLLSGAGGDDLFTGYRRHYALGYDRFLSKLPTGVLNLFERVARGLDQNNPMFRRLAKLFSAGGLEGDARLANYFVWSRESQLYEMYSTEFQRLIREQSASQPMLDFLAPLPKETPQLERLLALEQRFFLADHNLIYTDKMSMAAGVEVRVPFLDLDLVDFAATIPGHLKQRGREGKWVLKKAMEPYLPQEVIYRPKTGFGAPLRRWMRHELRELLNDILSTESIKRRGIFNPTAVQHLIHENETGRVDGSYTLLSLMCIELWCRHFVDSQANSVAYNRGFSK